MVIKGGAMEGAYPLEDPLPAANNPKDEALSLSLSSYVYKLLYDMIFIPSKASLLVNCYIYFKPSRSPIHKAGPSWAWCLLNHGIASSSLHQGQGGTYPVGIYGAVLVSGGGGGPV